MSITTRIFYIGAVCLLFAGCRSTGTAVLPDDIPSNFPNHSARQIVGYLTADADTLSSFSAKASMAVRSPDESLSFSSDLSHRRGDSLYMSIKPALGIEAARALVTADSFFVYDRIKKKLYYGDIAKAGQHLPGPISDDNVFGSLLGLPDLDADNWQVTADSSHYYLVDDSRNEVYTVDPKLWRVVRFERTDNAGSIVEYIDYSEFDKLDNFILARKMFYEHVDDGKTVSVYYRSLDLNPGSISFPFSASSSAERVPVE